ncbi:unnamed protein product, partial [Hymenolepis diminuta]
CSKNELQFHAECVEFVRDILLICRRCLARGRKTSKEEPIVSSSMPSTSTGPKRHTSVSQERLAVFGRQSNAIHVWVYNTECSKVDV